MKMLRHRETGEVMPMNADTARNDNMVPIEVPDPATMITYTRGVAYIEEKHIFGAEDGEEVPADPAPKKTRRRKAKAAPVEEEVTLDVDMGEALQDDA